MEKRDILNWQGIKIGEMEMPDGTPEERWAKLLEPYAKHPPSDDEKLQAALSRTVSESRIIADQIIEEIKKENLAYFLQNEISNDIAILKSLWTHHRLRNIELTVSGITMNIDLMNLIITGDLETAYVVLSSITPDDMTQPYHFLSSDRIAAMAAKVKERISL